MSTAGLKLAECHRCLHQLSTFSAPSKPLTKARKSLRFASASKARGAITRRCYVGSELSGDGRLNAQPALVVRIWDSSGGHRNIEKSLNLLLECWPHILEYADHFGNY